jgi:antitoxin VapB
MAKTATARLFRNGRSQAVRLPKEFRFTGERVRIKRVKDGVLLQPMPKAKDDVKAWFARLDRLRGGELFMPEGRNQPPMPPPRKMFD